MQQDPFASHPDIDSPTPPGDGAHTSPTPSRSPGSGRRLRAGLIAAGLTIGGVVVLSQRNEVALDDVAAGQCVQDPGDDALDEVERVDCADPHDMEVFAVVNIAGGENEPWPGEGEVEDRSLDACLARVESYIGQDFWDSPYDVTGISPVREGWTDGLHTTICLLINVDGSPLVGSLDMSG